MEIFIGWLIFSLLVGWMASARGRSGFGFFLISAVLSPLIGFIIILVLKDLKTETEKEGERQREHERQLEQIRAIATTTAQRPPAQPVAAPEPPRPAAISVADEIIKLAELRDKGVLTDEEFAQQKAIALAARTPHKPPAATSAPPTHTG